MVEDVWEGMGRTTCVSEEPATACTTLPAAAKAGGWVFAAASRTPRTFRTCKRAGKTLPSLLEPASCPNRQ